MRLERLLPLVSIIRLIPILHRIRSYRMRNTKDEDIGAPHACLYRGVGGESCYGG